MNRPTLPEDPSLPHRFLRIVRERPDHPMVEEWFSGEGEKFFPRGLTYREAFAAVCRLIERLEREIPRGESLVAMSTPPGTDFVLLDLALLMAGKIIVPIDHMLPENAVREVLETFGIRTLVTGEPAFVDALRPLGFRLLSPDRNGGTGHEGEAPIPSPESPLWDTILAGIFPEGSGRVAHLLLTSGTTGKPKGVPLTHENLLFDCDRILENGIYEAADRVLCVLPLHHSYPFMVNILLPLSVGATILFPPDLSPASLRGILTRGRVTLFPAVPALWEGFHRRIWEEIAKKPPLVRKLIRNFLIPFSFYLRQRWEINAGARIFSSVRDRFGPSMKALASGGAALRPEIARDFIAMGLTILEGYGLTETAPVACMNRFGDWRVGTVGRPLPGVEVRVDPPEGDRPGGRVFIRGRNVASSYWLGSTEKKKLVDKQGWFETGDLGLWQNGFLSLVGREKEVLVLSNGKNIFPEPLERMIGEKHGIGEAGVLLEKTALVALVRPDPQLLEREDTALVAEMISAAIDQVNSTLPSHSRIASFERTDEPLPRTRLGKLRRFLLPDIFRVAKQARLASLSKGTGEKMEGPLLAQIREIVGEVSGGTGPVEDGMNLESDLGIDSLARIELLQRVEEFLERPVPDELLSDLVTVGDLLSKISLIAPEAGGGLSESVLNRSLDNEELALLPDRGREDRTDLTLGEKIFYRAGRGVGRILFGIRWPRFEKRVWGRGETWGQNPAVEREIIRLPSDPFILVANHSSYLDGLVLALCLPPKVLARTLFWGFAPLFDGPLKPFRNLFGIVSIEPAQALSGLRIALHLLRSGRSLGVFPEGERSIDGSLQHFKPGVGLIVGKTGVPVVTVGLVGAYEAYPPHRTLPRPRRIELKFGPVLEPERFSGLSDSEVSGLLEQEIRGLLGSGRNAQGKG